jgi:predicted  nucleic acid-binding Zn-ribbon protein
MPKGRYINKLDKNNRWSPEDTEKMFKIIELQDLINTLEMQNIDRKRQINQLQSDILQTKQDISELEDEVKDIVKELKQNGRTMQSIYRKKSGLINE